MREAFTLLIDRQYIVDAIAQANQEVANTFIPTGMSDGNGGEFRAMMTLTPIRMKRTLVTSILPIWRATQRKQSSC